MSDLQKAWARNRLSGMPIESFDELEEEEEEDNNNHVGDLPEHFDDDSSSASSASSTGTIIPSPSRNLFARPQGYYSLASFIFSLFSMRPAAQRNLLMMMQDALG